MIRPTYDLWCDACGMWTHPGGLKGRKARHWAARRGWTVRRAADRTLEDVCPACNGKVPQYWASWNNREKIIAPS